MILIREIVEEAIATGYLTMEAEEQLRKLLSRKYDLEDMNAFMTLQQAVMAGRVKQEARELIVAKIQGIPGGKEQLMPQYAIA